MVKERRSTWCPSPEWLPGAVAERARFELANGVRPLRHFQCRALDQTRRPLRSESILSAVALARAATLARGPALEVEDCGDHRKVRKRLRKVPQHLAGPRVVFLGKQPQIIRRLGDPAEELLGLLDSPHLRQDVDQPEGADDERALRLVEL